MSLERKLCVSPVFYDFHIPCTFTQDLLTCYRALHVGYFKILTALFVACDCNPEGSLNLQCDEINGNCDCKRNVEGRQCERCMENKYNITLGCVGK